MLLNYYLREYIIANIGRLVEREKLILSDNCADLSLQRGRGFT